MRADELAAESLAAIRARGTHRRMRVLEGAQAPRMRVDGREVLLFAGSNYLDLARHDEVVELVREVASQVKRTGQAKRLHPMNPYERRLAHLTVRDYSGLVSRSEGGGFRKKITIPASEIQNV